jgi:hypothetical protein
MTLGPSPLYAAVALDWPHAVELPAAIDVSELVAWLEHHCGGFALEGLDRVVITETDLQVWRRGPEDPRLCSAEPFPAPTTLAVAPLLTHPSTAMLTGLADAGVLHCAAVLLGEDNRESARCNVRTDDRGRHLGPHLDGRFGDEVEWPNGNPADAPPPVPPAPLVAAPSRETIRGVMAGALWLCHHDPGHPLSYTPPDGCRTCEAIDRAAAAVHALIGAPA